MNSAVEPVIERAGGELAATLAAQQAAFARNPYPDRSARLAALSRLEQVLVAHADTLHEAIAADFGQRSFYDTCVGDLITTLNAVRYLKRNLKRWMRPERRSVGLMGFPGRAYVKCYPKGVVGIIGTWNFPLFTALVPLATALAAGNHAMVNLSPRTPVTGRVLGALLADVFSPDLVSVHVCDEEQAIAFSQLPFDHILFTGSERTGRKIMRAAAENLTPVTLELGGKSPAIVDRNMDMAVVAARLVPGKCINAGQVCVAPDYAVCPRDRLDAFAGALVTQYRRLFAEKITAGDMTWVLDPQHLERLRAAVADARALGCRVIQADAPTPVSADSNRYMPLTLVVNPPSCSRLMTEEIFGPVLPVLTYDSVDEALDLAKRFDRPLATYIFSFDQGFVRYMLDNTRSGTAAINEAAFQVAVDDLPFGGVGGSGMGRYHGKEGFLEFSNVRSVLEKRRLHFGALLSPASSDAWVSRIFKTLAGKQGGTESDV